MHQDAGNEMDEARGGKLNVWCRNIQEGQAVRGLLEGTEGRDLWHIDLCACKGAYGADQVVKLGRHHVHGWTPMLQAEGCQLLRPTAADVHPESG